MSPDTIEGAHQTLGLLRVFASSDEIKKAWRVRSNETHPDHGGNAKAFREVQAAAKTLLAEGAREFYQEETRRATAAAAQRAASYATSATSARPTSYAAPTPTTGPTSTIPDSVRAGPRVHRRPALLAAAILGFVIAPHLRELGLTWDPLPFHDFCQVMQSFDWVFLGAWWLLKKRVTP